MNTTVAPGALRIALLGAGTVGAAVARAIAGRAGEWPLAIAGIAVRDVEKARAAGLDRIAPLTVDALGLAASADVDVVVELMGGIDPARACVESALRAGRPVVTANKTMMAAHGPELRLLARETGTPLLFEAAVVAGVPFVGAVARRPLLSGVSALTAPGMSLSGTPNSSAVAIAASTFSRLPRPMSVVSTAQLPTGVTTRARVPATPRSSISTARTDAPSLRPNVTVRPGNAATRAMLAAMNRSAK